MLSDRFSYARFVENAALAPELAQEIERRLRAAKDRRREMHAVIEELRRLGHEIFSFDASDDWELFTAWGKTAEKLEWALNVSVAYAPPPSVSVEFRRRK